MKNAFLIISICFIYLSACSDKMTADVTISFKNKTLKDSSIISNITLIQTKDKNNKMARRPKTYYINTPLQYKYPNSVEFNDVKPGTYDLFLKLENSDSTQWITGDVLEIKIDKGKNSITKSIKFDTLKVSNKSMIPKLRVHGIKGIF